MNPLSPRHDAASPLTALPLTRWDLYRRLIVFAVGLVTFLILLANFVSVTLPILMLIFLCALIAVSIRGLSDALARRTPLSEKAALGVVLIALLVVLISTGILLGPGIIDQFTELGNALPEAVRAFENQLRAYSWGETLADELPSLAQLGERVISSGDVVARITGIFSTALSVLSSVVVALFITLYLVLEPQTYINNFLRLVPRSRRERIRSTLAVVHETLLKWLVTRAISMVLIGVVTFIGLNLIGLPLTVSLALLAALGAFIPTFGPIIALIPMLLIALLHSPDQVVLVLLLNLGLQTVDNYLVTPLVEKSMLYLPPAYIIAAQLLFGAIAGAFGLILAAPLAAALVVIVRRLYVEDVLNDQGEQSG